MAGIQGLCLQLSLYLLLLINGEVNAAEVSSPRITRGSFPKNFKFGAATSAYQVVPSTSIFSLCTFNTIINIAFCSRALLIY